MDFYGFVWMAMILYGILVWNLDVWILVYSISRV